MNRTIANRGLAVMILILVTADWLTKLWITNRLAIGDSWALIDGWLYLVHRQNPGVAFSMFANLPDSWRVPLLSVLSLVGIIIFTRIIRTTLDPLTRIAAAAVVAGAVANLGDRLISGEVTDFVFVTFFPYVFNLADSAITIGGCILAVRLAMTGDEPGSASPPTGQPA